MSTLLLQLKLKSLQIQGKKCVEILIVIVLFSCHTKQEYNDNNIRNGSLSTDSIGTNGNGPKSTYDSNHKLVNISYFTNGDRNGPFVNYFPNGEKSDSGFYENNLVNGYWVFFDSSGNKIYSTYFYKNLEYGPQLWYEGNHLHKYEFMTFDKSTLVRVIYKNDKQFDTVRFNTGIHILPKREDVYNLFAYLPKIPNAIQHFAIGIRNNDSSKELFLVKGFDFIIDTVLAPPPTGWNYYISCHIQDESGLYNKIFVEQVIVRK
jgi:hypothetical protein